LGGGCVGVRLSAGGTEAAGCFQGLSAIWTVVHGNTSFSISI
jgi:hypothetical protein